jgi:chromosome segregation ATPase
MSFSHSDGNGHSHSGEFDEEFLVQKMQKKFEMRITKLNSTINMHVEEKEVLSQEIIMWKKKHLDSDETNRDLHLEIKRLTRQCEEFKELQDMDADEDAMREHKLRKSQHHLKELEEKYHKLKKDYDALLHMQEKFIHLEEELHIWKEKCHHLEKDCHMWEEKFHGMEGKYHDIYGKIAIHMKTIKELEHVIAEHDHIIQDWETKYKVLQERCHHLEEDCINWTKKCEEWEHKHGELLIRISKLEHSVEGHDHIIAEWTTKCKVLEDRCKHLDGECHRW